MTTSSNKNLETRVVEMTIAQFRALVEACTKDAITRETEARSAGVVTESLDQRVHREMAEWIVRQWFSPKNQGKPWYRPDVTPANVFDVIFDPDSRFPYDQRQLLDMFQVKTTVGSDMRQPAAVVPASTTNKKRVKGGERSTEDIGQELGITHQRVDQIYQGAADKVRQMTGGKPLGKMHDVDQGGMNQDIDNVRSGMAKLFAQVLAQSNGDPIKFLAGLGEEGLLTPKDIEAIPDLELRAWMEIANRGPEQVEAILLTDIEENDNLFKTFQTSVAKRFAKKYLAKTGSPVPAPGTTGPGV